MALHSGQDIIMTVCDEYKSLDCPVCDRRMNKKRKVGPTSFAEALAHKGHKHDEFTCKNAKEKWHIQVRKLRELVRDTPSASIANMILTEIKLILETKQPTKEISDLFD